MKKSRSKSKRFGALIFIIPIVVIVGVVGYQLYSVYTAPTKGTLEVITLVQPYHSASARQAEKVLVNETAGSATIVMSPINITLDPGPHAVTFEPIDGYQTPASRTIVIGAGQTSYAVGLYQPLEKFVGVEAGSFNVTAVKAVQGVTPVSFVNISNVTVTIQSLAWESSSDPTGVKPLAVGENFTYVYQSVGDSLFWNFLDRGISGQVETSAPT